MIYKLLSLALFFAAFMSTAQAQENFYNYGNIDSEYSLTLPEAPTVKTIWADEKNESGEKIAVPYLVNPPEYGAIGEYAFFKRVDPKTGEKFDLKITFLKADRDFLISLTREEMEDTLKKEFEDVTFDKEEITYSAGSGTLKSAALTGFYTDTDNNLFFSAAHYLIGQQTLMMLRVNYNVENPTYRNYYKMMYDTIRYTGQ